MCWSSMELPAGTQRHAQGTCGDGRFRRIVRFTNLMSSAKPIVSKIATSPHPRTMYTGISTVCLESPELSQGHDCASPSIAAAGTVAGRPDFPRGTYVRRREPNPRDAKIVVQ